MPGPAAHAVEEVLLEILAPKPACCSTIVCDCCRRARSADNFDEDCFGICCDCLDSDVLLVQLDASIKVRTSAHS
ncbi:MULTISPECIES: hypothetical protein [Agrobacterium]|uniref:hypothetical protein n=1 Tax=Agrobacterium TaxID=357 RepID=UPI0027874ABA|nr:hypothetical protein [Agrobacterium sp. SORGH_AS_0745]MDP9762090.1 hypothetical protein [Agrobacterium tumefaciens]MDQ1220621.1 hypothetical protein [Agrobacterium sp. SORGH_AS_0745]